MDSEPDIAEELETEIEGLQELPTSARASALERLCQDHPEQAGMIRALAALHHDEEPEERRPDRVGPFALVRKLAEGGMGAVYLAEQGEPIRRQVAVKLIKLGMDSRAVIARFEAERQALAMMDHSSIAKVFDAGLAPDGRPYFAMEYIDGPPISEFCNRSNCSLRERLELIRQVCAGTQHAHLKGVIHRDLKPSNILVANEDGAARAKIIDFGLARATERRELEATMFTLQGEIVGTPAYMSPEQATVGNTDIDTRTDVYSIGVVMYELLTGALPFRPDESNFDLEDLRRRIVEDAPRRPSTQITAVSDRRRTWARTMRADLDWIVMMALAKEPERRYQSPAELAADITRYLQHEPIRARPPGSGYRLRRFVRKHRMLVAASAAVTLALSIALVLSLWFAFGESTARDEAEAHLANFDHLQNVVLLREARSSAADLDPGWSDQREAITKWLEVYAPGLERARPELQAALEKLRLKALPWGHDDQVKDRETHPDFDEYQRLIVRVRHIADARAVRLGERPFEPFEIDPTTIPKDDVLAIEHAARLSGPSRMDWGRAPEGLAILEHIAARYDPDDTLVKIVLHIRWGFALIDCGRDDEGVAKIEEVVDISRGTELEQAVPERLEEAKFMRDSFAGAGGAKYGGPSRDRVAQLEGPVNARRTYRFELDRDQFLHDTLREAIDDIDAFLTHDLAAMRERRKWCERIANATAKYADRWKTARQAIAAANGLTGHKAYLEVPLNLSPQEGFVPIGMNPVTRLWEFYDLRSARDPESIPEHRPDGSLALDGDSGMVFVLVPGGLQFIGEQNDDIEFMHYVESVAHDERMCQEQMRPYFLSRFEMTAGQWQRLSGDKDRATTDGAGALPVTEVSWEECDALMRRFRLILPTEAQWEIACRAKKKTRWSSGASPKSLQGFANTADRSAESVQADWSFSPDLEDGFAHAAPVGSFAPNAFGFYDMHGNVLEWCRDTYDAETTRIRKEDGLRFDGAGPKTCRGGSFSQLAEAARCAKRHRFSRTNRLQNLGVRPARAVR